MPRTDTRHATWSFPRNCERRAGKIRPGRNFPGRGYFRPLVMAEGRCKEWCGPGRYAAEAGDGHGTGGRVADIRLPLAFLPGQERFRRIVVWPRKDT